MLPAAILSQAVSVSTDIASARNGSGSGARTTSARDTDTEVALEVDTLRAVGLFDGSLVQVSRLQDDGAIGHSAMTVTMLLMT